MTPNSKITKLISGLLIFAMIMPAVLLSQPKKTEAQWTVWDPGNYVPNWMQQVWGGITSKATALSAYFDSHKFARWIMEQVLKRIAKAILARMTQAVINWINSDFHGSPLFIQNPESFFRDIAKSEIRNIVDMIGYDSLRFPFGSQTALNVINSYKRQLDENAAYTLSKVINDPDLLVRYRNDFNYGGWNGFLINTQYPQNNYIGFQSTIMSELASRLQGTAQAPAEKVQSLLQQGMGFLSPQTCPSNPAYNNGINEFVRPSFKYKTPYVPPQPEEFQDDASFQSATETYRQEWQNNKDVAEEEWVTANTCPGGLQVTTPGSVAANHISTALNMPFLTTALDGALGNSIAAIFDALINHFLDKGLNALADTVSPSPSFDNNWSYNGNSLSGGSPSGGASPLNIPQNVSVTVGQSTSTPISGGTISYSIQTPPNAGIATAQISVSGNSGPALSVTGVAPGQTFVVIKDSSAPVKTVAIQITVNAIGALSVVPRNILTDISHPITATISGGEPPYNMILGPNEATAIVVFTDTSLVISGIALGETSFIIGDSSTPMRTITVPITITGPGSLIVPQSISANIGQTTNTTISGGTPPYSVQQIEAPSLVNVQISGNTIMTTGVAAGQTIMIIKDTSLPNNTATINMTITDTRVLLVIPSNIFANIGQIISTAISGGHPPYSIQTPADINIANAQIWNSSILITGVASGQTSVVVKDSSTPTPQTFTVPITIGALTVAPQNVSTSIGQVTNVTISGGTPPYTITTDPTAGVATAERISFGGQNLGNNIAVTGRGRGQTSMIVSDSSVPAKTAGIQITVN